MRGVATRVAAVIRVDAIWLATEPLDMRAGTETALARGGGRCSALLSRTTPIASQTGAAEWARSVCLSEGRAYATADAKKSQIAELLPHRWGRPSRRDSQQCVRRTITLRVGSREKVWRQSDAETRRSSYVGGASIFGLVLYEHDGCFWKLRLVGRPVSRLPRIPSLASLSSATE